MARRRRRASSAERAHPRARSSQDAPGVRIVPGPVSPPAGQLGAQWTATRARCRLATATRAYQSASLPQRRDQRRRLARACPRARAHPPDTRLPPCRCIWQARWRRRTLVTAWSPPLGRRSAKPWCRTTCGPSRRCRSTAPLHPAHSPRGLHKTQQGATPGSGHRRLPGQWPFHPRPGICVAQSAPQNSRSGGTRRVAQRRG